MENQIINALNENNLQFDFVGTYDNNSLVIELPKSTNKLHVARVLKSLGFCFLHIPFGFELVMPSNEIEEEDFTQLMQEANQDFFKNTIEEASKTLTPIQQLDKECLESHIESLIVLNNEAKEIESKISYQKEAIQEYAIENGILYSDSSHSVSLVYTPSVEWNDEQIENCDTHIAQFEDQIKAIKVKQEAFKEMRKARITELQNDVKNECLIEGKGINQIWKDFGFIKSLKDAFQVRISKSKISKETGIQKSDFERSWIYKK